MEPIDFEGMLIYASNLFDKYPWLLWLLVAILIIVFYPSRRLENDKQADSPELTGWLCNCGNWQEDDCHCSFCGSEPPWGCPCGSCQSPDENFEDDFIEPGMNYYGEDLP